MKTFGIWLKQGTGWAFLFCGFVYLIVCSYAFGATSLIPLPIVGVMMSLLISGAILVK